jgi:abortive infection Abi-like protein
MTTTVQRLSETRRARGAGHGRASEEPPKPALAHLAAAAGAGVANYLLGSVVAS